MLPNPSLESKLNQTKWQWWSYKLFSFAKYFTVQIITLRQRQNGRHFADDTFNRIFVNENARISIKFSLKFVRKGPINNIPALVQIMAWRRPGYKPLSEPVMVSLLTHICVTQPQWVKSRLLRFQLQYHCCASCKLSQPWMSNYITQKMRGCYYLCLSTGQLLWYAEVCNKKKSLR